MSDGTVIGRHQRPTHVPREDPDLWVMIIDTLQRLPRAVADLVPTVLAAPDQNSQSHRSAIAPTILKADVVRPATERTVEGMGQRPQFRSV